MDFVITLNCGANSVFCIPDFYRGFLLLNLQYHFAIFHNLFTGENISFEQHSSFPLSHDGNRTNKQMLDGKLF